ncbi:CLUMA_CG015591, isoform A [Clunio marinus]|uniref:CLUMA_CG015591, isoform A n=1 Tax=Clunio marinus TaxID=568069 RepID=A0A1J1IT85_9DIPT|nr:CLUMA_CG015591, isoform A [Clunio marinus]
MLGSFSHMKNCYRNTTCSPLMDGCLQLIINKAGIMIITLKITFGVLSSHSALIFSALRLNRRLGDYYWTVKN